MYSNVFLSIWSSAGLWPKFSCSFILAAYYMLAWRSWHTAAVAQALICLQFLFSTTSESPASCIWSLHNPLRNLGQRIPACWSCPLAHSASQSRVMSYSVRQIRVGGWTADVMLTSEYDLLLFFWHHQADCGDEMPLVSIKHPYRVTN